MPPTVRLRGVIRVRIRVAPDESLQRRATGAPDAPGIRAAHHSQAQGIFVEKVWPQRSLQSGCFNELEAPTTGPLVRVRVAGQKSLVLHFETAVGALWRSHQVLLRVAGKLALCLILYRPNARGSAGRLPKETGHGGVLPVATVVRCPDLGPDVQAKVG